MGLWVTSNFMYGRQNDIRSLKWAAGQGAAAAVLLVPLVFAKRHYIIGGLFAISAVYSLADYVVPPKKLDPNTYSAD